MGSQGAIAAPSPLPPPSNFPRLQVSDTAGGALPPPQALQELRGGSHGLTVFPQSVIIPSLAGSHHQVIPLLIKILQPLITQLIIAVFASPGLAMQALGEPGLLFPEPDFGGAAPVVYSPTQMQPSVPLASTVGRGAPVSPTPGATPETP